MKSGESLGRIVFWVVRTSGMCVLEWWWRLDCSFFSLLYFVITNKLCSERGTIGEGEESFHMQKPAKCLLEVSWPHTLLTLSSYLLQKRPLSQWWREGADIHSHVLYARSIYFYFYC